MRKLLLISILINVFFIINSQTLYVSPTGSTSNSGSTLNSPTTLTSALAKMEAGTATAIYLREGEYSLSQRINLNRSGSESEPLCIYAYESEKPVLNGKNIPVSGDAEGIRIIGNYYHIKGLEVKEAYSFGIRIRGSYNTIENCVAHHNGGTGIGIQYHHGADNPDGTITAYNTIINCDSYMNFSWYSASIGGNADGFCCSLGTGKGNKFYGCRAWSNSDDGFDLFESFFAVEIENCWTWGSGIWSDFINMYEDRVGQILTYSIFKGDGNGFKMGGDYTSSTGSYYESLGIKTLKNSVSFNHKNVGITQNSHKDGVLIEDCVSFNNLKNIRFWLAGNPGATFNFKNNIIFGTGTVESGVFNCNPILVNNSWEAGQPSYSASDFVTVSLSDALAPREADGSLPDNNFAKLKNELNAADVFQTNANDFYLAWDILHILQPQKGKLYLYKLNGSLVNVYEIDEMQSTLNLSAINSGLYLIHYRTTNEVKNLKVYLGANNF